MKRLKDRTERSIAETKDQLEQKIFNSVGGIV
jgi:hypothetical protein